MPLATGPSMARHIQDMLPDLRDGAVAIVEGQMEDWLTSRPGKTYFWVGWADPPFGGRGARVDTSAVDWVAGEYAESGWDVTVDRERRRIYFNMPAEGT